MFEMSFPEGGRIGYKGGIILADKGANLHIDILNDTGVIEIDVFIGSIKVSSGGKTVDVKEASVRYSPGKSPEIFEKKRKRGSRE